MFYFDKKKCIGRKKQEERKYRENKKKIKRIIVMSMVVQLNFVIHSY